MQSSIIDILIECIRGTKGLLSEPVGVCVYVCIRGTKGLLSEPVGMCVYVGLHGYLDHEERE